MDENETPLSAAIRELREETGFYSSEIEWLGTLMPDTGRLDTRLWCYIAKNAKSNGQLREKGLELSFCAIYQLKEFILSGRMSNALDLAVINLALLKQKLTL